MGDLRGRQHARWLLSLCRKTCYLRTHEVLCKEINCESMNEQYLLSRLEDEERKRRVNSDRLKETCNLKSFQRHPKLVLYDPRHSVI